MKPLVHFLLTGAIAAGLVAVTTDVQAQAKPIPMRDFSRTRRKQATRFHRMENNFPGSHRMSDA